MKYNNFNTSLKIKTYGRNIQELIAYAKTIEDKEKRTLVSKAIIQIMGNISNNTKEEADYESKLWTHLMQMGDGDFDIDIPENIAINVQKPEDKEPVIPEYLVNRSKIRQYGYNIELLIEQVAALEDREKQLLCLNGVANVMKLTAMRNNYNFKNDQSILEHLKILCEGKIEFSDDDIALDKLDGLTRNNRRRNNNNSNNRNNKNRRTNNNRNYQNKRKQKPRN